MDLTEPVPHQVSSPPLSANVPYTLTDPAYRPDLLPHVDLHHYQYFDFTSGKSSDALISGWSEADVTGVWSGQRTAYIGFLVTDGGQHHAGFAIIKAGMYLKPPTLNVQTVEVWANHTWIGRYLVDKSFEELKLSLSNVSVENGGPLLFSLSLPNAAQVHPSDSQAIALNLKTLEFVR